MKALLIVDIQNDFCPGGALAVTEGDLVITIINRLRDGYPLIVHSRDWHPKNHLSFAVNNPGKRVGEVILLNGSPQVLWPIHCVQGSKGAEFHPALVMKPGERIFDKGTNPEIDSYSVFYDNAHRKSTGLLEFLKASGMEEIHLCGLATDYCVKFSALDALAAGLRTVVIARACRGVDLKPGDSERALTEIEQRGGIIER